MNLLYDLTATQSNSDGKFHGGGKYAKIVFLKLASDKGPGIVSYGVFNVNRELDEEIRLAASTHGVQLIGMDKESLQEICEKYAIDRFYSALPYQVAGITGLKCEVLGTIHGLRELEVFMDLHSLQYLRLKKKIRAIAKMLAHPIVYKRKYRSLESLVQKIRIFTVSQHTKYALMAFFPKSCGSDIKVFYSPDVTGEYPSAGNSDFGHSDYFLLVSGNRWLKNNLRAVLALDELFTGRPDITNKVIITGVSDKDIYLRKIKNRDRFVFYDYVDEDLLKKMYKNSFAFIYLTLNEGFGYPPLEAMKFGIPVITSPFTSIPEVCDDAVLYSNPYSIPEIKNRILQLQDKVLYESLRSKGVERYKYIKEKQDLHLTYLTQEILSFE